MPITEVTMYRAVCDHEGCDASPQDDGEFFAWKDPQQAVDEGADSDWDTQDDHLLCPDHARRRCEVCGECRDPGDLVTVMSNIRHDEGGP